MSLEQDITFGRSPGDNEPLQGTVLFQDNGTLDDMQCFGFAWQNMPDYLLSWEWSACSFVNHEAYTFPIPPYEPVNYGQETYHLSKERSFKSSLSLVWESEPSSAVTEASPFSEAFGLAMLSVSDNLQPSDPVQLPSGPSTSQPVVDTTEPTTQTQESLPVPNQGHPDEPLSSGALDSSRTEVRRPKVNPSRGRRRGKNAERNQLLPVTKDQQRKGRRRRTSLDKEKRVDERIKLERNRRAAAKCRDRKRDLANALDSEMEELRDRQQQLSLSYNQLRSEAVRLKTEVLRHGDCDCGFIRRYISAEANKSVDRLTRPDDSSGGGEKHTTAT